MLITAANTDTKTIHEFLAENPNVDVSAAWQRCWKVLSGIKERVDARFPLERHPSCAGRVWHRRGRQYAFEAHGRGPDGGDPTFLSGSGVGTQEHPTTPRRPSKPRGDHLAHTLCVDDAFFRDPCVGLGKEASTLLTSEQLSEPAPRRGELEGHVILCGRAYGLA